jgi:hypothetical protein
MVIRPRSRLRVFSNLKYSPPVSWATVWGTLRCMPSNAAIVAILAARKRRREQCEAIERLHRAIVALAIRNLDRNRLAGM